MPDRFAAIRALVALLAIAAIALGAFQLDPARQGLVVTHTQVGETPVTVTRPGGNTTAPVVVISHGFAGSRELMQAFSRALAHHGYCAVTFDFPGHGDNPTPLRGAIAERGERYWLLYRSLEGVVELARTLPGGDGIALLGHSMASDVQIGYALDHPDEIMATVAVSPYVSEAIADEVTGEQPANLLFIYGALEPQELTTAAYRITGMKVDAEPRPGVSYGDPREGDARRIEIAPGVEHIGVLYSTAAIGAALDWLDAVFGRSAEGDAQLAYWRWLGLVYLGLIVLAWPLSHLLPRVSEYRVGSGLGWRWLAALIGVPTLLTPLLLTPIDTDFMPSLLGDYLALHFALFGLITLVGLYLASRLTPWPPVFGLRPWHLMLAVVASVCFGVFALVVPTNAYLTSLWPSLERLPVLAAVALGTLTFFIADEWLTRGEGSPPGAYTASKVGFMLSLMLAIMLNLYELFFLVIMIPAFVVYFVIYGLLSHWSYRRTLHPLPGAVTAALGFAWAIATVFPVAVE